MPNDVPKGNAPRIEPFTFRFRIVHLLYVTAFLASSLATFGTEGLCPATVLLIGWTYVFASKSRAKALLHVGVLALIGFCLCGLLPPSAREASRRMWCANNLKQIGLALHNYHDIYKTFPPAYIPDENGKPKHSWRVLILPFLEQQSLYDAYDFDEPWDGPNNRQLANPMPRVYACPNHHPLGQSVYTSYLGVVGTRTMWRGDEHGVTLSEVPDGTANTLLVLEANSQDVNWLEPRDIDYESALELLTSRDIARMETGHRIQEFFYEHWNGRNMVWTDGSAGFLRPALTGKAASGLLIRNDGAPIDFDHLPGEPVHRFRLDNCFRLVLFVLIALFPLPWVWRRPETQPPTSGTVIESVDAKRT